MASAGNLKSWRFWRLAAQPLPTPELSHRRRRVRNWRRHGKKSAGHRCAGNAVSADSLAADPFKISYLSNRVEPSLVFGRRRGDMGCGSERTPVASADRGAGSEARWRNLIRADSASTSAPLRPLTTETLSRSSRADEPSRGLRFCWQLLGEKNRELSGGMEARRGRVQDIATYAGVAGRHSALGDASRKLSHAASSPSFLPVRFKCTISIRLAPRLKCGGIGE